MHVVVAHNRYQSASPSGENAVVARQIESLSAAGVRVSPLLADSNDLQGASAVDLVRAGLGPVRSSRYADVLRGIHRGHPVDVLHVHNVFPMLSPSLLSTARQLGIRVVHTVHNYRHSCIAGTLLRDDEICTKCLGQRASTSGIKYACYRSSRLQSIPMTIGRAVHTRTWRDVDRHLCLTPFMAQMLTREGIPASRITLLPNATGDPGADVPPPGLDLLYAGRLDVAKGVEDLVASWSSIESGGRRLRIAGSGPREGELATLAAGVDGIELLGLLGPAELAAALVEAAFVVVPSKWFEGYPLIIAEAFAHGRPVIAPRLGSLADVVDPEVGILYEPGQLRAALQTAVSMPSSAVRTLAAAARARYERDLQPSVHLERLLSVYAEVLAP